MKPALPAHAQIDRAHRIALVGLVLSLLMVIIFLFTFRGLVYLTLPLSALAFVCGIWGTVFGSRLGYRAAATVAFLLGLLLLLLSLAALAANLNISDHYDVYTQAH